MRFAPTVLRSRPYPSTIAKHTENGKPRLNIVILAEFVKLQKTAADSPKSWTLDAKTIDQATYDLSVKNPNGGETVTHRSPQEILEEIAALDGQSAEVLKNIKALLK